MKTLYIIPFLAILMASCNADWLDVTPPTSVETDKAITTEAEAQTALRGVYRYLSAHGYYGDNYIYYAEVKGEDMQCRTDNSRGASFYRFDDKSGSSMASLCWNAPYVAIRQANNIIAQIETGKVVGNAREIARVKAEALAARGLAHFDLAKLFGLPYTLNNGESLGVPIQTKAMGPEYKPARNTVAQCYQQAIDDFTLAIPDLAQVRTDGAINVWTAKALLSRIYLYMGDMVNALSMAEEVMDGPYKLWTNAEYASVWGQDFSSEVIFELIFNSIETSGGEGAPNVYWENGYNDIILTEKFLELLQEDPNDIRNEVTAHPTLNGVPDISSPRKYLIKFPGKNRSNPMDNNMYVIRLSEVYLTAAEASFKQGDIDKAQKYLNAIVTRANPDRSVLKEEITLDRILLERRKELVGEGHFFFDAMRTGRTITRKGGWHLSLGGNASEITTADYRIALPIPQAEMDANKNMKQNDGY